MGGTRSSLIGRSGDSAEGGFELFNFVVIGAGDLSGFVEQTWDQPAALNSEEKVGRLGCDAELSDWSSSAACREGGVNGVRVTLDTADWSGGVKATNTGIKLGGRSEPARGAFRGEI